MGRVTDWTRSTVTATAPMEEDAVVAIRKGLPDARERESATAVATKAGGTITM